MAALFLRHEGFLGAMGAFLKVHPMTPSSLHTSTTLQPRKVSPGTVSEAFDHFQCHSIQPMTCFLPRHPPSPPALPWNPLQPPSTTPCKPCNRTMQKTSIAADTPLFSLRKAYQGGCRGTAFTPSDKHSHMLKVRTIHGVCHRSGQGNVLHAGEG